MKAAFGAEGPLVLALWCAAAASGAATGLPANYWSAILAWGLSDKIAVIASTVGFLQFAALVATVRVMIGTSRRQLRAYVLPDSASIFDGMALKPPQTYRTNVPGVVLLIKNSGQTPAYHVVSWAKIDVIPVTLEHQLVVPKLSLFGAATVGAGCTFNKALWFHRPLTPQEIAYVGTGTSAIYLYGRVEYRDAFGTNRFTDFRLHYAGPFPAPDGVVLNFCEKGNEAN